MDAMVAVRTDEGERSVDDALVDAVPLLPPHCRVLDAGCGAGEEALFLAKMGLDVTAIDRAADAVAGVREKLVQAGLRMDAFVADIREFVFIHMFGLVNMRFVLHEVSHAVRAHFLAEAMQHTEPGGIHAVSVLTGCRPDAGGAVDPVAPGELVRVYDGWEILRYEKEGAARQAAGGSGACSGIESITVRRPALN